MATTLTPAEQAWLQQQVQAGNYGAILGEAANRGLGAADLAPYTGFTPQQINSYALSPAGQQALFSYNHPVPQSTTGSFPNMVPTPPTQGGPVAQPVPSFDQYVQSLVQQGRLEQKQTGDGRTYYQVPGQAYTTLDESGQLQNELQQNYQNFTQANQPYGTNIGGAGQGAFLGSASDPTMQPFTLNGQQAYRIGISPQDFANNARGKLAIQQGFDPNSIQRDPANGYYTDPKNYSILQSVNKAQNDAESAAGTKAALTAFSLPSIFSSLMNLGGIAATGTPYQSLISSLGQNAASQGGSFADFAKQFGFGGSGVPAEGVPIDVGTQTGSALSDTGSITNAGADTGAAAGGLTKDEALQYLKDSTDGIDFIRRYASVQDALGGTDAGQFLGTGAGQAGLLGAMNAINPSLAQGFGLGVPGSLTAGTAGAGSALSQVLQPGDTGTQDAAPVTNGTPTLNPGNTFNPGSLLNSLTGNSTLDSLLKGLIPAGLGALGANSQANALERMQDKYLSLGEPYRNLLGQSYAPGFSMNNEPGYKDALDMSSQSVLRKLSAGSGNPFDQPSSMTSALDYVTKGTALPALQNYRGQLGQFGQLGVSQAAPLGAASAQAQGGVFDALGFGASQALNPQPSLSDLANLLRNSNQPINNNTSF